MWIWFTKTQTIKFSIQSLCSSQWRTRCTETQKSSMMNIISKHSKHNFPLDNLGDTSTNNKQTLLKTTSTLYEKISPCWACIIILNMHHRSILRDWRCMLEIPYFLCCQFPRFAHWQICTPNPSSLYFFPFLYRLYKDLFMWIKHLDK